MMYKKGDIVTYKGERFECRGAWCHCEPIISRYGRIIDLAKRIGIKPTKKFARRLKRNRHAEDPKFVTLPSHKQYKRMLKQIEKRILRETSIPLPRLDTPDGYHSGSLIFAGLPILSPELSNKKYFIGVDVADAGSDKSSETIIDTHTGKIVGKEALNG